MQGLLSWLLIAALTLSACASGAPATVETDTETSETARLPEVLSAYNPGERIEVWAKNGECFEASFVSYEASTLTVENKSYERTYQRDNKHHRDQVAYGIDEIARVGVPQKPELTSFAANPYVNAAIGFVLITVLAFGIAVGIAVHKYH